jgi:hypothetical protein
MTPVLDVLLPVGALIAGSLLTMVNQSLTDRRTYSREREARRDDFRIRRFEIERDTLLALQDLLISYEMLPEAVDVDEGKFHEAAEKARMLAERCLDAEVRDLVEDYVFRRGELYFYTEWPAPKLADECMHIYVDAQHAIGDALRSDPFDRPLRSPRRSLRRPGRRPARPLKSGRCSRRRRGAGK